MILEPPTFLVIKTIRMLSSDLGIDVMILDKREDVVVLGRITFLQKMISAFVDPSFSKREDVKEL